MRRTRNSNILPIYRRIGAVTINSKWLIIGLFINIISLLIALLMNDQNIAYATFLTNLLVIGIVFNVSNSIYIFNFGMLFNVLWYIYSIGIIVRNYVFSMQLNQIQLYILFLSIISLVTFNYGYLIKSVAQKDLTDYSINSKSMKLLSLGVFILSVVVRVYVVNKIGISNYIFYSRASRSQVLTGMKYLIMFYDLIYLSNVLLLDSYFRFGKKIFRNLFILSLAISTIMAIIEIDRSNFLKVVLPISFILYYYKKVSFKKLILLGLTLLCLFISWKSLLSGIIFGNQIFLNTSLSVPAETYAWTQIAENIIEGLSKNEINYKYGYTYYKAFESLVRPIFQNYEALSTWYVKNYHYDVYIKGGGFAFSSIVEAYLNFGIFGVAIVFFLFGFFVKKIEYRVHLFNYRLFYALLLSVSYKLFRSEFYSIFKNSFWIWGVPIIIITYFSSKTKKIRNGFILNKPMKGGPAE